ncbi:MAG: deoxyguanosinetriphosphate triphosphohydrolase [Chloroflexi bacterium]|nr:deoxyguanosinetriphosphate triphosphohydrolase [Chloroflexota bacterium]
MDFQQIRKRTEAEEFARLSPFAVRSALSKGRLRPEEPSPVRTCFQRDRDRITHSKSFRRLMHKTQVFIAPPGDHYRTRLTHTLEVSQIARTVARALRLNEDLCEAIGLGHDLGHPPFGHSGEEALEALLPSGFRHNEQSLRVADLLENDGAGLNLTFEVRDGILHHSKPRESIVAVGNAGLAATLEGQIVKLADSVAYINHDVDDALRARLIADSDLPEAPQRVLGLTSSGRINTMVCDIVENNWYIAEASARECRDLPVPRLAMSQQVLGAADELREFLFENVYTHQSAERERARAMRIIEELFNHLCRHPEHIPEELVAQEGDEPISRIVGDYIAGMTDRFAIETYQTLLGPLP